MKKIALLLLCSLCIYSCLTAQNKNAPLRIIMIGAHPDDCDLDGGGTAILFASLGHKVKFLSVTNGDAGHQSQGGGALAKRRMAEAKEAGKRFGVEYDVLDNHDGELLPSLEVRRQIIRKIREWNADIVIAPRPNDYHPDHRYTSILVQDASYMVAVPNVTPDVPALKKNPVFLYFQDNFQRPNPFRPDIAVDITAVFDKKVYAITAHQSQIFEWLPWIGGYSSEVPSEPSKQLDWASKRLSHYWIIKKDIASALEKWYGKDQSSKAKYAEAFEVCEYGFQPDATEIKRLFPMLGN
ncbi:MAG TPA: PIG-L family deacetylase [Prolixibacteraceae bacterium]